MINANELRIGNWVNFSYQWKKEELSRQCKVISIGNDIVVLDKGVSLVADFNPIPLTPEILEKAGFNKIENSSQFGWYFNIINRTICWCHGKFISIEFKPRQQDDFNDTLLDINCEYLHQLQNIIFALTGEELNIQL